MMPGSGALKLDSQPGKTPNLGIYEPLDEFKQRGLKFSAQSIEKKLKSADDAHHIVITLANDGDKPLTFLKWGSPFEEEISNKIVSSEPKTSVYLGYIANRKPDTLPATALATVQPGTELSVTVDLNKLMAFQEKRNYKVSVNFLLTMVDTDTSPHQDKFSAEDSIQQMMSTTFDVEVKSVRTKEEVDQIFKVDQGPGGTRFEGCDSGQENVVARATAFAQQMLNDAALWSNNGSASVPCRALYEQWLGDNGQCQAFDPTITESYQHMLEIDQSQGYIADCGTCNMPNTYAYVYPADPHHVVYLCEVFWRTTTQPFQRDSQPGTLIHEWSHFNDMMDTNDYQYGTTNIQALARDDPCTARRNADNIEAFAEYVDCPDARCSRR